MIGRMALAMGMAMGAGSIAATGGMRPPVGTAAMVMDFVVDDTPTLQMNFVGNEYLANAQDPSFPGSFVDIYVWG